jgi:hypothetical protein
MRLLFCAVLCVCVASLSPSAEAKPEPKTFKVFVKSGTHGQDVASNLRARIGSSSKYSLVSEETSELKIFVDCIPLQSTTGIERGFACYEAIMYMPLALVDVRMNTFLGSSAAAGGRNDTEYIGRVLFEDFVALTTEDDLNAALNNAVLGIMKVSQQMTPCPPASVPTKK